LIGLVPVSDERYPMAAMGVNAESVGIDRIPGDQTCSIDVHRIDKSTDAIDHHLSRCLAQFALL
jgi:hypothetical protein